MRGSFICDECEEEFDDLQHSAEYIPVGSDKMRSAHRAYNKIISKIMDNCANKPLASLDKGVDKVGTK